MTFDVKEQIKFKPEIRNAVPLNFDNVIIGGMGGSALPARAMFYLDPVYPLWLHNDFGLPEKTEGKALFIAISYSGNTAETISFAKEAYEKNFSLAVITSGGVLKDFAEENNIAHVLVPEGLQPRDALVYMLKTLLVVLGKEELEEVRVDQEEIETEAEDLADFIAKGEVLIYSSSEDSALGYIWKIYLNESAKLPAFCGIFPELFHNELESLDAGKRIILLSESKNFLEMAGNKGWNVRRVEFLGSKTEKLVKNLILARAVARRIAEAKSIDPDAVPVIEEFKKL